MTVTGKELAIVAPTATHPAKAAAPIGAETNASKTGSNSSGKKRLKNHKPQHQSLHLKQQHSPKLPHNGAGGSHRRSTNDDDIDVDIESNRYPYCIVWTPLPVVTWFIPIIGHTGIANSKGIIYDFSDDYDVTVDNFAFGTPTKFYQFHPDQIPNGGEAWDKAIQETADYYSKTRHSLFFNNCHQYIAGVLNKVKYWGRADWSQTEVWSKITFRSQYVGCLGFVRQWWPFTVIVTVSILILVIIL